MKKLVDQRDQLRNTPCLTNPESLAIRKLEQKRFTNQINSAIITAKRKALQQKVQNFHNNADENVIAQQLLGQLSSSAQWTPIQHQLIERQRLCSSLFRLYDISDSESALKNLINLYSRFENIRTKSSVTDLSSSSKKISEQDSVEKQNITQSKPALVRIPDSESQK